MWLLLELFIQSLHHKHTFFWEFIHIHLPFTIYYYNTWPLKGIKSELVLQFMRVGNQSFGPWPLKDLNLIQIWVYGSRYCNLQVRDDLSSQNPDWNMLSGHGTFRIRQRIGRDPLRCFNPDFESLSRHGRSIGGSDPSVTT